MDFTVKVNTDVRTEVEMEDGGMVAICYGFTPNEAPTGCKFHTFKHNEEGLDFGRIVTPIHDHAGWVEWAKDWEGDALERFL